MTMGRAFSGLVWLAVFALALSSCVSIQTARPRLPAPPTAEGPVTADALSRSYVFGGMKTFKSEVNVSVFNEEGRVGTFKGVFAYMSPDSMRLRLFGPVGMNAVEMLASGRLMQLYVPNKKTLYEGRAPSLAIPQGMVYSVEETADGYVLYAFRPGGASLELVGKYSFDRSLRQTGLSVYTDRKRFIDVRFGDFSGRVPGTMKITFFNGYVMDASLVRPVVDADIPQEYFRPMSHDGKNVRPIGLFAGGN
jgi:hypothetical protein